MRPIKCVAAPYGTSWTHDTWNTTTSENVFRQPTGRVRHPTLALVLPPAPRPTNAALLFVDIDTGMESFSRILCLHCSVLLFFRDEIAAKCLRGDDTLCWQHAGICLVVLFFGSGLVPLAGLLFLGYQLEFCCNPHGDCVQER